MADRGNGLRHDLQDKCKTVKYVISRIGESVKWELRKRNGKFLPVRVSKGLPE